MDGKIKKYKENDRNLIKQFINDINYDSKITKIIKELTSSKIPRDQV